MKRRLAAIGNPAERRCFCAMSSGQTDSVVIVGCDPAVLHSLQLVLQLRGFCVTVHRHPLGLLSSVTWPRSGCLLIEHNLPTMPGLDLLKALRARGVMLPTILFTSMLTTELVQQASDAGAFKVHGEPLAHSDLVVDIETALRGGAS